MNGRLATAGAPSTNTALPRTDEGHELAPQARVAVVALVVTEARPC